MKTAFIIFEGMAFYQRCGFSDELGELQFMRRVNELPAFTINPNV